MFLRSFMLKSCHS